MPILTTGAGGFLSIGGSLLNGSESDGTNTAADTVDSMFVSGLTRTSNATVAPDGTTTAASFIESAGAGRHIGATTCSGTTNKTVTWSVYAKMVGRRYLQIKCDNGGGGAVFDLQAGVVTDSLATPLGSAVVTSCQAAVNGFYKCTYQFFTTGLETGGDLSLSDRSTIAGLNSSGNVSYTGDGVSGIYVWRVKATVV